MQNMCVWLNEFEILLGLSLVAKIFILYSGIQWSLGNINPGSSYDSFKKKAHGGCNRLGSLLWFFFRFYLVTSKVKNEIN